MCSPDLQNITDIIKNNLEDYDVNFLGWSGLVRRTFLKYSIPADPLQYLQYPWLPDRWRRHCKEIVVRFWDDKLREEVSTSRSSLKEDESSKSSLKYLDVTDLSTDKIHPVYRAAGLDSLNVTKSTVVMWFLLGVFHCKSLENKMKKAALVNVLVMSPRRKISNTSCYFATTTWRSGNNFWLNLPSVTKILLNIQTIPMYF